MIRQTFEELHRGRAIGLCGAMVGLATVEGQLLGGFLVSVDWRAIFLINLRVSLFVLVAASHPSPRQALQAHSPRFSRHNSPHGWLAACHLPTGAGT